MPDETNPTIKRHLQPVPGFGKSLRGADALCAAICEFRFDDIEREIQIRQQRKATLRIVGSEMPGLNQESS